MAVVVLNFCTDDKTITFPTRFHFLFHGNAEIRCQLNRGWSTHTDHDSGSCFTIFYGSGLAATANALIKMQKKQKKSRTHWRLSDRIIIRYFGALRFTSCGYLH